MGGGTSHTTTTQELSPEQRALIEPVIPVARRFIQKPPKQFPGTAITGFNPLQSQAQQMTLNAANSLLPMTGQIPQQFQNILSNMTGAPNAQIARMQPGMDFLTSGDVLKAESNPYLQSAIEAATRPTLQMFREQIMPGITGESLGAGGFGGTRQGIAEGIASRGATQTVGDIASSMSNTNYQAGLDAMLGGMQTGLGAANTQLAAQQAAGQLLGNAGGILGQTLLPAQMTEAVGAQRQSLAQAQLNERVQKFINQQMIPFAVAQDVASMAFGMPGGTTRSSSTQPGNPMMGMQMGMGALSMLPMLLGKSDRRLKENIEKVAKLVDGLVVYVFNFIGDATKHLGLMANEVEILYPEAVFVGSDGYKKVKYLEVPTWIGWAGRRV